MRSELAFSLVRTESPSRWRCVSARSPRIDCKFAFPRNWGYRRTAYPALPTICHPDLPRIRRPDLPGERRKLNMISRSSTRGRSFCKRGIAAYYRGCPELALLPSSENSARGNRICVAIRRIWPGVFLNTNPDPLKMGRF